MKPSPRDAPRIACLLVPDLLLLAHLERPEALFDLAHAVVDPGRGRGGGAIRAASPRAAAEGVAEGQGLAAALPLCPDLATHVYEPARVAAAQARLLEVASTFSPTVEDGRAVADPARGPDAGVGLVRLDARGLGRLHGPPSALLDALVTKAESAGFPGAVAALADGPFTAAVLAGAAAALAAAATKRRTPLEDGRIVPPEDGRIVPPGADRAALSPLPLACLHAPEVPALSPDALTQLRLLSVRTAGAFAALPASAVETRFGAEGLGLHRLARGETRRPLHPWAPPAALVREHAPDPPVSTLPALEAILGRLLADLDADLRQADRGLVALEATFGLARTGIEIRREIEILDSSSEMRSWLELLKLNIESSPLPGPVARIAVRAARTTDRVRRDLDLFTATRSDPVGPGDPAPLERVAARLRARLGEKGVGTAALDDRHRPEAAFHLEATLPGARRAHRSRHLEGKTAAARPGLPPPLALRLGTPRPTAVETDAHGRPRRVDGRAAVAAGPFPASGEWWAAPYDRLYFEVATETDLLWIFRDGLDGCWYVHGTFD
jgi:protein ImuB